MSHEVISASTSDSASAEISGKVPAKPRRKATKPSKVEVAKEGGHRLRGTIDQVLRGDADHFEHDDIQLLKFHGIYQQDDRDTRAALKAAGGGKAYSFMVRTRLPGGRLPAEAYLGLDHLADRVTHDRSLRITTRQTLQFHGIVKGELRAAMAEMNRQLVTSLAACGDVGRNVMAPPAPLPGAYVAVQELAEELSRALEPQTGAYHEIWVDGAKAELPQAPESSSPGSSLSSSPGPPQGETESLYGDTYLPRKFKTAVALPDDNTVDVYTQDVGLVAVTETDDEGHARIVGVNLLVGGGLGMTHRKADTFARLGSQLGYVSREDAIPAVQAIARVFRDHGNRSDRKHARIKYLIEEWGQERFRAEVEKELGRPLAEWVDVGTLRYRDHVGLQTQADGRKVLGLWIENGRVVDRGRRRLKTGLRAVVEALRPTVIFTPDQNLLLADLDDDQVNTARAILKAYGSEDTFEAKPLRRFALACPALPTCGLALTESERFVPYLLDDLEVELESLGLDHEELGVRMTGCPNGCARPYTADLGFVGRKPKRYDIYVGGRLHGDRLSDLWDTEVHAKDLVTSLRPLLRAWAEQRQGDEGLGDFYQRIQSRTDPSLEAPRQILTGDKGSPVGPAWAAQGQIEDTEVSGSDQGILEQTPVLS